MNEDIRELTGSVLSYMLQNNLVLPPNSHTSANANVAVTARIVACMLLGLPDNEIKQSLETGYRPETASRFFGNAKVEYELIRRENPDEFSEYLVANAKSVTPTKKRLPKTRKSLPNKETPSTHVNADGSIVEMKDVLNKEEGNEKS